MLAIGPRRRLEGERIRDTVLAASGLLSRQVGGPSVFPPQPASVTQQAYGRVEWQPSSGAQRYRRSLYTYAKRTAPFAALAAFDGPTGETCLPRRDRSTSPLQALTLLNDAMFVEIAAALAEDVLDATVDADPAQRARLMFRRLAIRPPSDKELRAMVEFFRQVDAEDASQRWMLLARALMNLDEVITTP